MSWKIYGGDFLETEVGELIALNLQRLHAVRAAELNESIRKADDSADELITIFQGDLVLGAEMSDSQEGEEKKGKAHGLEIGDPVAQRVRMLSKLEESGSLQIDLEVTQNGRLAVDRFLVR